MKPKQQLAELIDAFAIAKSLKNETLQRIVLAQVNQFFSTHTITPTDPSALSSTLPAPEPLINGDTVSD